MLDVTDVQAVYGLPASGRVMGAVQLVVSELVTNARKYASVPCLLTPENDGGCSLPLDLDRCHEAGSRAVDWKSK
ncbi:hypothetical protein ACPB9E_17725 [Streptomyces exfoliatus]|uniref:hypothetical protein n=1 Tax=Streptomyces exfoliatus TaxID=1905 RepID=UPI003C2C9838